MAAAGALLTFSSAYADETYTPAPTSDTRVTGYYNSSDNLNLELVARHNSLASSEDGGSLEIVTYNSYNGYAYAVSGLKGKLIGVDMNKDMSGSNAASLSGVEYDIKPLITNFEYGDMTSVAVSDDGRRLAIAVQSEDYSQKGVVALFSCNVDGSLKFLSSVSVGVQPDMVVFAGNDTILSADEGEPREGINGVDPKGSVTIIHVAENNTMTSQGVYFDDFDSERDLLTQKGVLIQKDKNPSEDFEPEYIAVSDNIAYVSLQENNSIAILDIANGRFKDICPLGFQDYGQVKTDLEKNDAIELKNYEGVYGIKMPDGISVFKQGRDTYILTANEGDSRSDWEGYDNEAEGKTSPSGNIRLSSKVVWFNTDLWDGLDDSKDYVFGGRSFSIYQVSEDGLTPVFDSEGDFEAITAKKLPDYFNASNNKTSLDNRSGKKGPEPESVVTGTIDGKSYAFIGLERIGGVMVYDITVPSNSSFVNYINSREFDEAIKGDVSPEGLCFIPKNDSPTGNALILTACEVSGTLAVYECQTPDIPIDRPMGDSGSIPATLLSLLGAVSFFSLIYRRKA